MMDDFNYNLPFHRNSDVAKATLERVLKGMSPHPNYLQTRYPKLNGTLVGGFHQSRNVLLSGLSGSGKSFFLRMLHQDFANDALNGKFPKKRINVHFTFEMDMTEEGLRDIIAATGLKYSQLLGVGEKITPNQLEYIKKMLEAFSDRDDTLWINTTGTVNQVEETIYDIQEKFPDHMLITSLDHGLLTERAGSESEVEMMANLAKMYIRVRQKLNNINFLVGQLKDTIEDPKRREFGKQFPKMGDIFGSKQVFHAMDHVIVIHRPEMLHISQYGSDPESALDTDRLIALHSVKNRFGEPNKWLPLTEDFANGRIIEYVEPDFIDFTAE